MKLLELTLDEPVANVALDEALLETAEQAGRPLETLRLWEARQQLVVIGRSSRVDQEVRRDICESLDVPIVRRCSGGAAVVAGPGCLMYAVVLSYDRHPELRAIDQAHQFVLDKLVSRLAPLQPGVTSQGISDLAWDGRKVSGNSLRCKRHHLLYHGTLLYDFPLPDVGRLLKTPPRQPDYRAGRSHDDFVANLALSREAIRGAVIEAFGANSDGDDWPQELTEELLRNRYRQDTWNFRL